MAQIDSPLLELAAAASAAILTTGRKLNRNFSFYRSQQHSVKKVTRDQLLKVCKTLRGDLFGLYNLFIEREGTPSPFMVSIAGDIHDAYEQLHREILFYNADCIETVIPIIDAERSFWNLHTDHRFYNIELCSHIEHSSSFAIETIEAEIGKLPEEATL